jgi:putative PIN family toxin of toxin-antitoxin system
MKIVIDNNIYISAFKSGGKPYDVFKRAVDGFDTLFFTSAILVEVEEVLGRPKFKFGADRLQRAIQYIKKYGNEIPVLSHHKAPVDACRDPDDIKYLECADAAKADYIVSGDKHLLEMGEYKGIKIVNANDYLEITTIP